MTWTLRRLKEDITEMLAADPEADRVSAFRKAFEESCNLNEIEMPTEEQVKRALDALVAEGVAQKAGREGYEATYEFMVEREIVE